MCPNLAYRLQHFESGWRCLAVPERRHRLAVTLSLVGQIELSDIEHDHPAIVTSYLDSPETRAGGPPCADELPPTFDGSLPRRARAGHRTRPGGCPAPPGAACLPRARPAPGGPDGGCRQPPTSYRSSATTAPSNSWRFAAREREREVHAHPVLARTPGRHPKRTTVRRKGSTAIGEGRIPWARSASRCDRTALVATLLHRHRVRHGGLRRHRAGRGVGPGRRHSADGGRSAGSRRSPSSDLGGGQARSCPAAARPTD